jgi:ubiquinone/menaquinone biosynthesis C-methylase UbiE
VQEIEALMNAIQARGYSLASQDALDFGCGIGRLTQALARHFKFCYGVDISGEMIELAKRYNQLGDRCRYLVNPSDRLPDFEDNSFDFIYTNIVLQHMEKKYTESYLKEFIRILRPKGLAVFQLPSSRSPDDRSFMKRLARLARLRDQIQHALRRFGVGTETLYRLRLTDIPAVMEMHCFERSELEAYIKSVGGIILDVERFDTAGPGYISYRYYVTKKH